MLNHEHFETLCVLAVTGQLAGGELLELTEHCESCSSCCLYTAELAEISSTLLLSPHQNATRIRVPAGMYNRFILQGQREGISLLSSPRIGMRAKPIAVALTASLALLIILLPLFRRTQPPDQPNSLREERAAVGQSMLRAPFTSTVRIRKPVKVLSGHTRLRELRHPAFADGQRHELPPLPLLSSGPVPGLRFYVPASRAAAYLASENYPWVSLAAASGGRNSPLIVRPFADTAPKSAFRFNPQLIHVAYVGHPPDFLVVPRPLTFQIPTTQ